MKTIIVITLLIFLFKNSNAQSPISDFSADITYGNCNYASACFSYNNIEDSVCWDYGDSNKFCNSNSNATCHAYTKPGNYTVVLTVWNGGIKNVITKPNLIIIRNPPQVKFDINLNQDSIYAPATINFINKTIKGDGDSLTYVWDFNDNTTSNDTNPVHTYNNPRTYSVSLMVKDNLGCNIGFSDIIIVKDTAQRNEINYITSSCSDKGTSSCGLFLEKHFIIQDDTLHIYGNIQLNCCGNKTVTVHNVNDTVFIRDFETGIECTCTCNFCFAINVPNIYEDSIKVSFDGQIFTAIKGIVSVSNIPFDNPIKIFPNPATNQIQIITSEKINEIELFNMESELVLTTRNKDINIEQLASGMYIVKLTGDDFVKVEKFIKE